MRIPLYLATLLLLIGTACSGDPGSPDAASTPTEAASPRPNPTIITATETPAATQPPGATGTATSTPPATTQPTPTASPAPTEGPSLPAILEGDVEGFPFGTADVRTAAATGGFGFEPIVDRAPLCAASSVEGVAFWSANLVGSDSGPLLVLWIYADPEALQADWNVEPGSAPSPRFACELPNGFVYWNENAVLALEGWLTAGADAPIAEGRPSEHPAIAGFLSLVR